ncbi:MAG TPA: hypothetical protein VIG62_13450 [Blastocatellia bacterium]|jgi:cell division septum initiation protein DivIVA
MSKEDIQARIKQAEEEESQLRRRLGELQEVVQNAPGSHRPGAPPQDALRAEREIRSVVLALSDLDRKRQELTVALSLG